MERFSHTSAASRVSGGFGAVHMIGAHHGENSVDRAVSNREQEGVQLQENYMFDSSVSVTPTISALRTAVINSSGTHLASISGAVFLPYPRYSQR